MPTAKKRPKSRRASDEPAAPPHRFDRNTFVVDPGLKLGDLVSRRRLATIIDLDRCETAAGSVEVFQTMLFSLHDELRRRRGAQRSGAMLRMADVGVVVRDRTGARVWAPEGEPSLPTLYACVDTKCMFACYGQTVVAPLRIVDEQ